MHALISLTAQYLVFIICAGLVVTVLKLSRDKRPAFIIRSVVAAILAFIFSSIGSALYYDPRPFVTHHATPLIAHAADNGFPSDHMLLATWAAFMVFTVNKRWGIVLAILALFVGVARVAASIHSPIDIVGSAVFSALAVAIVSSFKPKSRQPH